MFDFSQTKINLLSETSRRFYQKKKRDKNDHSFNFNFTEDKQINKCNESLSTLVNPQPKLKKIIKIFNTHNANAVRKQKSQRLYERFHTQGNFQDGKRNQNKQFKLRQPQNNQKFASNNKKSQQNQFDQQQFMKKQLKARIDLFFKKLIKPKQKIWKQLLESYEDVKYSDSLQAFTKRQNIFYSKFVNILKISYQDEFSLRNDENFINNKSQNVLKSVRIKKKLKYELAQNKVNELFQLKQQKSAMFLHKSPQLSKSQSTQNKLQLQNAKLLKQNLLLRKQLQKCLKSQSSNQISKKINQKFNRNQTNNKGFSQEQKKFNNSFKIDYINSQSDDSLITNLKNQIAQLTGKIQTIQTQNIKLKDQLFGSTQTVKTLRAEKTQTQNRIIQLKIQNQSICSQIVQIRAENQASGNKLQKWRATLAFQCEQLNSYQNQLLNVKNEYKDLNRKYKALMKKINKLNNTSTGQKLPDLPQSYFQMFNQQVQCFNKVRNTIASKNSCATLDKSVGQKGNIVIYKNFSNQKQTVNNVTGIKRLPRQHYGYFKPNFYTYLQSYLDLHGIDQKNYEIIGSELSIQFLATIRAILDSKLKQFLDKKEFCTVSSFANFTYSWLNTFKVHQKTKRIIQLKEGQGNNLVANFYISLMRQRLNSNWEIIAFRQFLMNTLTKDQLFFYLLVRHAALKGDMVQNISGMYQQIVYINISQALMLIQKFVGDLQYKRRLEQFVKKSIIYIRKRALIDLHFLCRIILEYYIFKKHQDFINLSSLVELLSRQKTGYISFQTFMKIFEYNFTYLTFVDKLNIYQKCFSASREKINLQVLLTVLSQEGYLCHQVRLTQKYFHLTDETIKIVKNENINKIQQQENYQIQPNIKELVAFQEYYRQKTTILQKQLINRGLENQKKLLQNNKQLNIKTIFSRINFISTLCVSTLQKLFYSKKISIEQMTKTLPLFIDHFNKIITQTIQKKQNMEYANEFKRNAAAKKIIRFYRKKKNQMHRNFIFNIGDNIAEEDEKVQNLRQQFTNMISNLKNKYQTQPIAGQTVSSRKQNQKLKSRKDLKKSNNMI